MKLEKGKRYFCIDTVRVNDGGEIIYTKGKIYKSERDCCLTNDLGEIDHVWTTHDKPELYFMLVQEEVEKEDRVNHPSHYTWLKSKCGIEVIDITRHLGFNIGNAIKYLLRGGHKDEQGFDIGEKMIEDYRKAIWYINDQIKMLEKEYGITDYRE